MHKPSDLPLAADKETLHTFRNTGRTFFWNPTMLFESKRLWSLRTLAEDAEDFVMLARINNPCLYGVSRA